jgi:ABC-type amino acid transport substrate-binding protein
MRPADKGLFVMRKIVTGLMIGLFILAGATAPLRAQDGALQTLIPPTLVPTPTAGATPPLINTSALERIRTRNPQTLVIGLPSNLSPFASITETGDYEGFEADLARAIAEDWGVKFQFRQVTRQNGLGLLQSGQIDLLMGQQMLTRDLPDFLDFSDPIFMGKQVALAMNDAPIKSIQELGGKTVGVVIGSPGEEAFNQWAAANALQATVNRYPMLDDGLRDLGNRTIVALVGDRWELDRRVRGSIEGVQLLQGTFRSEPYAIAMLRYDDDLRTLVNRTLQRMVESDRYTPIYDRWFPKDLMPEAERVIPRIWGDLDSDPRTLADFQGNMFRADKPMIPRLKAGEPIRVAGLGAPAMPDGQPSSLDKFNQALIYEMARRWGAQVQFVPNSFSTAEDVLASGAADMAVGLAPHWGTVDRIDYVGVYALRGYRLMVRIGSDVEGFGSLRYGKRAIATFSDDPKAFEIARKLAISVGLPEATIQNVRVGNDADAVQAIFELQSARGLFADALHVVPLVAANTARVQLTGTLYNPTPLAFGVPRNDVEFRILIDITLQEMSKDGTYQRLWKDNWGLGDPLGVLAWPGTATPFGVKTTG